MGDRIQFLAVVGSLVLLAFVFDLLRRRILKEEYSLLWLGSAAVFLVVAAWNRLLESVASLIGIYYPPAALFLVLTLGSYMLLMHFSLVIYTLTRKNKKVAQVVGLLRMEIERLKREQTTGVPVAGPNPLPALRDAR